MADILWTARAASDLERLSELLVVRNPTAAQAIALAMIEATERLGQFPHIGARLAGFGQRDVRRIIVRWWQVRYEVVVGMVVILRVRHVRENR